MLKPGDVVTDLEKNSIFCGKQGLVLGIQLRFWRGPTVIVRFDRELYPYYLSEDECPNGIYKLYYPTSLRKDEDWEPEVYARRLFGERFHLTSVLKERLNSDNLCLVEGCSWKQQKTIWFNVWGTVYNAHVCMKHASKFHGRCGDTFPWRKRISA